MTAISLPNKLLGMLLVQDKTLIITSSYTLKKIAIEIYWLVANLQIEMSVAKSVQKYCFQKVCP